MCTKPIINCSARLRLFAELDFITFQLGAELQLNRNVDWYNYTHGLKSRLFPRFKAPKKLLDANMVSFCMVVDVSHPDSVDKHSHIRTSV